MTPNESSIAQTVEAVAETLRAAVLVAEHLRLAASATAQDAAGLTRSLQRATEALGRLRPEDGAR